MKDFELCPSLLNNTWENAAGIPTGRHGHSCGVVPGQSGSGSGREVVVVGGTGTEHSVEIYSVETNTWRKGDINSMGIIKVD